MDETTRVTRDDGVLIDRIYKNLIKISAEIESSKRLNPELINAFSMLLDTYFAAMEDGF